jgi:hypothetical protein
MPDALRYAAHHTHTRDHLVFALDRVRRHGARWHFLILEAVATPFYLQFTSHPGPGMRAEAVGDDRLPVESQLSQEAASKLRELGWSDPPSEREGRRHDNWSRSFGAPDELDLAAVAQLGLTTMEDVYGVGGSTRYRIRQSYWFYPDLAPLGGA